MPLHIIRQDISKMHCDAIVNTTNSEMIGYSGVDLAIHTQAGEGLDDECASIAPLELGFAKITGGYNLDCKYVIHTSGPIWKDGNYGEKAILKSCYTESLRLAKEYKCNTVAFPLISSGIYGYPKDQVLTYAVEVIAEFLKDNEMTIFICVFDEESYEFSKVLFDDIKSFIDNNYIAEHKSSFSYSQSFKPSRNVRASKRTLHDEGIDERMICASEYTPPFGDSLEDFMKDMGDGFASTLFAYIDAKGMTDVECYKKANVDKKTFSKIKCNTIKTPRKRTAVAFAIALELDMEDTRKLLASAGLALSHSNKFDMIIEYFILKGNYNIFEINEALFEFDQELLGSL